MRSHTCWGGGREERGKVCEIGTHSYSKLADGKHSHLDL